jgi:hypothetical protein
MMIDRMDLVAPPVMPLVVPARRRNRASMKEIDDETTMQSEITRVLSMRDPNAPIIMRMVDRMDLMAPPVMPLKIPARRRESLTYRCEILNIPLLLG